MKHFSLVHTLLMQFMPWNIFSETTDKHLTTCTFNQRLNASNWGRAGLICLWTNIIRVLRTFSSQNSISVMMNGLIHYWIPASWNTVRSNGRGGGKGVGQLESIPSENLERLSTEPINVSSTRAKVGPGHRPDPDSAQLSLRSWCGPTCCSESRASHTVREWEAESPPELARWYSTVNSHIHFQSVVFLSLHWQEQKYPHSSRQDVNRPFHLSLRIQWTLRLSG
jgi:hypothetical protein